MNAITAPYLKESFLPQRECDAIIRLIETYSTRASGAKAPGSPTKRRTQVGASSLYQDGFCQEAELLASISSRVKAEIEHHLKPINPIFPGYTILQGNYEGDSHVRHADSRRFDKEKGLWVPNHTPNWVITCGIYLNRGGIDFCGGELVFSDLKISISPSPGLFVAYPSDERFEHEVPVVTSGSRYSIFIWFTDNPKAKERPLVPETNASASKPMAATISEPIEFLGHSWASDVLQVRRTVPAQSSARLKTEKLIYAGGTFFGAPVDEWQLTFHNGQLHTAKVLFIHSYKKKRDELLNEPLFNTVHTAISAKYGPPKSLGDNGHAELLWRQNRPDPKNFHTVRLYYGWDSRLEKSRFDVIYE